MEEKYYDDNEEKINSISNANYIEWTTEHEEIMIEWADKAMCYRWLHSKANANFSRLNAWYTIPVIVISTLTGTANFAQERVPVDYQSFFVMIVGGFNILAGIITTIQQFLKITQLCESHRVSSIAWDKFYRNIKIELAKHPTERMEVKQMLKLSKEEFDRLMETSPNIPEKIIKQFKLNFFNREEFDKIVKPEVCDILISTNHYRNQWFNEDNRFKNYNENMQIQLVKINKQKRLDELNTKIVNDFIVLFKDLNNREPLDSEIIDNLRDKMDVSTIEKNIENYKSLQLKNANNLEEHKKMTNDNNELTIIDPLDNI
jgi:hypothetical protein